MERLFKWFTLEVEITNAYVVWFASEFRHTEFTGIDQVLVLFLEYCSFLSIPAKRNYLEAFLATEGKKFIKEYNIKIETMDSFDYKDPASLEEACRVIYNTTISTYESYCQQDLSDRNFKVDIFEFIQTQKVKRVQMVMAKTFPLLTSGGDVDDVVDSMQLSVQSIAQIYNVEKISDLDFLTGKKSEKKRGKMRHLFNTSIPAIDGASRGVFSKQLLTLAGGPGTGKSRFLFICYAYQCAVVFKRGVLIRELELSQEEVENILIAHHITNIYGGKVKIPDSLINTDTLTDEQSRYVESARMDLFESKGKYGRIEIDCNSIYVEEMEKSFYSYLKLNKDIELIAVDYAGLFKSRPTGKYDKRLIGFEIIQEGYKSMKEIAKNADIAIACVNQFNKEGVEASFTGKNILPGHIEGGQIVQRHSDFDLAMCMTEEQELANIRTLSTVKKRAATGFHNVPLLVDLSVSIFRQQRIDATS